MSALKQNSMIIRVVLAVILAVVSFTVLGNIAGSVDSHRATISELDEEKSAVTKLLAGSTAASAAITVIPEDVGTPIADKLADLSTFYILILSVLYAEKYLLTLIGLGVFKVLIPVSCGVYILCCFAERPTSVFRFLRKLVIVGLVIFHLIPLGAFVSRTIETTYRESINAAIDSAVLSEESNDQEEAETEDKGWWTNFTDSVGELKDSVVSSTVGAVDWAKTVLNNFIEATAIMLVTSCLIPFLVSLATLLLLKKVLRLDLPAALPRPALPGRNAKNNTAGNNE